MRLNNIVLFGTYEEFVVKNKRFYKSWICNNVIILSRKNTFNLYLTNKYDRVLNESVLKTELTKVLTKYNRCEISEIELKVCNFNLNGTIYLNGADLITKLLPKINVHFSIEELFVTQERYMVSKTNLQHLVENPKAPFLNITIKLFQNSITTKFQYNKRKIHFSVTTIVTKITEYTSDFLKLLDKNCGGKMANTHSAGELKTKIHASSLMRECVLNSLEEGKNSKFASEYNNVLKEKNDSSEITTLMTKFQSKMKDEKGKTYEHDDSLPGYIICSSKEKLRSLFEKIQDLIQCHIYIKNEQQKPPHPDLPVKEFNFLDPLPYEVFLDIKSNGEISKRKMEVNYMFIPPSISSNAVNDNMWDLDFLKGNNEQSKVEPEMLPEAELGGELCISDESHNEQSVPSTPGEGGRDGELESNAVERLTDDEGENEVHSNSHKERKRKLKQDKTEEKKTKKENQADESEKRVKLDVDFKGMNLQELKPYVTPYVAEELSTIQDLDEVCQKLIQLCKLAIAFADCLAQKTKKIPIHIDKESGQIYIESEFRAALKRWPNVRPQGRPWGKEKDKHGKKEKKKK